MSDAAPLTLFRWGYWGWGNATSQLVQAVDAVELSRGFEPPVFVDARISRSVRAAGFNGDAFGKLLGTARYHWMNGLGNTAILSGTGGCSIKTPTDAGKLLDLACVSAGYGSRVIFFCSCERPIADGCECHRVEVSRLVLAEAKRRGRAVNVEEWPGGGAKSVALQTTAANLKAVRGGRKTLVFSRTLPDADLLGLPWGSAVTLTVLGATITILSGPAKFGPSAWCLPVLKLFGPDTLPAVALAEGVAFRADHGYV